MDDVFYSDPNLGKKLKDDVSNFDTVRNVGNTAGEIAFDIDAALALGGGSATATSMGLVGGLEKSGQSTKNARAEGASTDQIMQAGAEGFAGGYVEGAIAGATNKYIPSAIGRIAADTAEGAGSTYLDRYIESGYKKGYVDSETGQFIPYDSNDSRLDRGLKAIENVDLKDVAKNAAISGLFSTVTEATNFSQYLGGRKNGTADVELPSNQKTVNSGIVDMEYNPTTGKWEIAQSKLPATIDPSTNAPVKPQVETSTKFIDTDAKVIDMIENLVKGELPLNPKYDVDIPKLETNLKPVKVSFQ